MLQLDGIPVLIVVFTIYLSLLGFQITMLYVNCVCVLKACFKRINDNLAHIPNVMKNDVKQPAPSLICLVQRNQFLLIELKTLKKQHLMVSDTVQMLNIIFSPQLLATVTATFITITFGLYFHIVRWQHGVFFSLNKELIDVFLMSMASNIFKITLVVWACETGKNQAQEIVITIHDLLNSTNDEQIKNELHLFSLQTLHCKNTFSTKGLTVDATLLTVIVGNITTYLLILIQFLNVSHSCDGKTTTSVR
ncbi:PREDICTED: putative gustatory receptor 28b [Vollenhovia emeryi]|uniref:putative gustatory receptor 28b n=1 Tax=Vollenhovia emeryi TaxID=411798 RepID=UPI0005F39BC1|nr:PREDICTED: putative gustatory receptor 28b [Vollenhovia emeryi]